MNQSKKNESFIMRMNPNVKKVAKEVANSMQLSLSQYVRMLIIANLRDVLTEEMKKTYEIYINSDELN